MNPTEIVKKYFPDWRVREHGNFITAEYSQYSGESGPGARPMDPEWVRDIKDRCIAAGVAFFFKQWGGVNKKKTGRILDGRTWDELPGKEVD